jgi:23S rRNA (uracil1939-C5)-methyltransferase
VTSETVRIDKLVAGGDGLAHADDGRVVFVPGVVDGELVEVEITESRRDFARGRLVQVIEASPDRREPPCPHVARGCGGCDWQHIDRKAQGRIKRSIVTEAFARTARMQVEPLLRRLDEAARRTTVRVASDGNGAGFRMAGSNDVVPVDVCMVAHAAVNEILAAPLLDGAGEVTIRVGARTGEIGLLCHEGRLDASVICPAGPKVRVNETVGDHTYSVSMDSFFQSSPEAAELIIDSVRRRLDRAGARDGRLVDAYGGVGLFSLAFSDRFDELMVVESSPSACRDALRNLDGTAATIEEARMEHWDPIQAGTVIADPSRHGLGKGGVAAIEATDASCVVLVSCDPVAGARDAKMLVESGYRLVEMEVLDIFPETHHVEVVTLFTK